MILPGGEPTGQLEVEGVVGNDEQGVEDGGQVGHNSGGQAIRQLTYTPVNFSLL